VERDTVTVINAGALCMVTPLSVALTKRPAIPAVLPAVKVTAAPLVALSVPSERVRVHEYVVPEGHVEVHLRVVAKA
jgi:hypothetical protein